VDLPYMRIEIGLTTSGFIVFAILTVIWIIGLMTIGATLSRSSTLKRLPARVKNMVGKLKKPWKW